MGLGWHGYQLFRRSINCVDTAWRIELRCRCLLGTRRSYLSGRFFCHPKAFGFFAGTIEDDCHRRYCWGFMALALATSCNCRSERCLMDKSCHGGLFRHLSSGCRLRNLELCASPFRGISGCQFSLPCSAFRGRNSLGHQRRNAEHTHCDRRNACDLWGRRNQHTWTWLRLHGAGAIKAAYAKFFRF